MDEQSIWELLSELSLGTVVAWITVVVTIIGTISAGTIKLYKFFEKYKKAKDRNEKYEKLSEENNENIKELRNKVDSLYVMVEEQKNLNYKQTRDSIVQACDNALCSKAMSSERYKSLMEMYDEYTNVFKDMHPNGYVKALVNRVCNSVNSGDIVITGES